MYAADIYIRLIELDLPGSTFQGIGWTKVVRLLAIVTKENVKEWVEKAKVMSRPKLEAHIKAEKEKNKTGKDHQPKTVITRTFKLHPDQKQILTAALEKAMKESNTDVQPV